jgi:hypothetical protein
MIKKLFVFLIMSITLLQTYAYVVYIPSCTTEQKPNIAPFTYTVNGTVDNNTTAYMCHDDKFLHIRWWNID